MLNHRVRSRFTPTNSKGFTILELLIATAVFGTVLILLTLGITQITRAYYKGTTSTNTQNVARDVINTLTQSIQFGGGLIGQTVSSPTAGTTYFFCVGNQEYDYEVGFELSDNSPVPNNHAAHALVLTNNVSACPTPSQAQNPNLASNPTLASGSRELLAPNMRLSQLKLCYLAADGQCSSSTDLGTGNLFEITVQITYGDDDLLNNPNATDGSTTCKGGIGSQFCDIVKLQATVEKRLL